MKLTFLFLAALYSSGSRARPTLHEYRRGAQLRSIPAKIGDDRATADFLLHKVKLTQKLDVRDVEDLQGKGAVRRLKSATQAR